MANVNEQVTIVAESVTRAVVPRQLSLTRKASLYAHTLWHLKNWQILG